jgi:hypothetical protein
LDIVLDIINKRGIDSLRDIDKELLKSIWKILTYF